MAVTSTRGKSYSVQNVIKKERKNDVTDAELVETVLRKTEVDCKWLFQQAYYFAENPEESWFISWKVKEYKEEGKIPPEVSAFCHRIYADHPNLFYGS